MLLVQIDYFSHLSTRVTNGFMLVYFGGTASYLIFHSVPVNLFYWHHKLADFPSDPVEFLALQVD